MVVKKIAEANFPTRWGQFRIFGFEGTPEKANGTRNGNTPAKEEAVALVMKTFMPRRCWYASTRNA